MNKNSKNANFQSKLSAMRLAEIKATDKEDLIHCASDMQKTASLNEDEAIVVANAIRAKYLPNVARQAGLDVSNLDLEEGKEIVDFTNNVSNDDEDDDAFNMEADDEEDDDDDMSDDMDDDDVNVDDEKDVATIEIEVPAEIVEKAQRAVQKALDNLLSGHEESDSDEDMDEMDDMDDEDMDDMDDEDMDDMDDEEDQSEKIITSKKVNDMNKTLLAERKALREALIRKAEREEILMKLASDEETVQTSASFKYNEPMVSMSGHVDFPTKSLENDGGNSLKDQNPKWNESRIPTNMPESLQFPDITKPMKLEGTTDSEVRVDWKKMMVPSEGLEDFNLFEEPTQMPGMPHKTTVAAKSEVECTACGTRMSMTDAEMHDASTKCANKDCPTNAEEGHEDGERSAESTTELVNDAGDLSSGINSAVRDLNGAKSKANDAANTFNSSLASLETARLKTAYSCSSKLALAGIITTEEVDSYAEQMLNDGLKADSMIRQTKLLLKSAQSSSERIAAASAERMSTRTASNIGISTTPAFSGGHTANSAAHDIQSALKGLWTMPTTED